MSASTSKLEMSLDDIIKAQKGKGNVTLGKKPSGGAGAKIRRGAPINKKRRQVLMKRGRRVERRQIGGGINKKRVNQGKRLNISIPKKRIGGIRGVLRKQPMIGGGNRRFIRKNVLGNNNHVMVSATKNLVKKLVKKALAKNMASSIVARQPQSRSMARPQSRLVAQPQPQLVAAQPQSQLSVRGQINAIRRATRVQQLNTQFLKLQSRPVFKVVRQQQQPMRVMNRRKRQQVITVQKLPQQQQQRSPRRRPKRQQPQPIYILQQAPPPRHGRRQQTQQFFVGRRGGPQQQLRGGPRGGQQVIQLDPMYVPPNYLQRI